MCTVTLATGGAGSSSARAGAAGRAVRQAREAQTRSASVRMGSRFRNDDASALGPESAPIHRARGAPDAARATRRRGVTPARRVGLSVRARAPAPFGRPLGRPSARRPLGRASARRLFAVRSGGRATRRRRRSSVDPTRGRMGPVRVPGRAPSASGSSVRTPIRPAFGRDRSGASSNSEREPAQRSSIDSTSARSGALGANSR